MATHKVARATTRERILDVALDVFAEHGFVGTSISEVERRVGLAAGTGSFYRHFASKEELLRAAVDREVEQCLSASNAERAALSAAVDPRGGFAAMAEQILRDLRRFDRLFRLMLTEGERVPEVRDAVTAALRSSGAVSWAEDPVLAVAIAALVGLHTFGLMGGGSNSMVSQDVFISTLAELTGNSALFDERPES